MIKKIKLNQNTFFEILSLQNDTSSLSVAHLLNRTSSPLEALNSILNRSIAKRTHFFRFVGRLRVFESKKSNDMASAVNSQSSQFSSGNKKYQMRNKKIKELTKAFDSGGIDVEGFLESMSSDPYRMCLILKFTNGQSKNWI